MGAVEQSSGEIESYLSSLEESYGSFSINQQTVTVSAEQYDREYTENDSVEVYVKVENESQDILHLDEGGEPTLPSTTVPFGESLEPMVKSTVAQEAGVNCRIQTLETVTILGLHKSDSGDSETLYRLAMVFEAKTPTGGGNERVVWKDYEPESSSLLA